MALVGIDLSETRKYVSELDKDTVTGQRRAVDDPDATVFELGVLDPIARAHVDDSMTRLDYTDGGPSLQASSQINLAGRALEVVRFGLKDVKNLLHPQTKKAVPFKTVERIVKGRAYHLASDDIIQMIPVKVIGELAKQIALDNVLSEGEAKN